MALLVALIAGGANPATAQFLRLGPLDFGAQAGLELVYTTNVEQERESQATAEMEDYYGIVSFDMDGRGDVGPSTQLQLQTGIAIEKHVNRPDLDNSESPFGDARLEVNTEVGYLFLDAFAGYENTSSSADDTFVPGGKKKRDVRSVIEYGGGVAWKRGPLDVGWHYDFDSERHDDEEFQDGDRDTTTIEYYGTWKVRENLGIGYRNEKEKTELVNSDEEESWKTTETILVDWVLTIIERPKVTYSFGIEKEDTDEEEGEWEPIHRLTIADKRDLTPTLKLDGSASYTYEQNPEEDDIQFTYGVGLTHQISDTAEQSLTLNREPVDTFGSSTDTDSTLITYGFSKKDLFFYNLSLLITVSYDISEPLDKSSPTEKTWTYEGTLEYTTAISRRLTRELAYEYYLEDLNTNPELLEEHRVTLSYIYVF